MRHIKAIIVASFTVAFLLAAVFPAFGQGVNYEKIALLKWYPAIQGVSFPICYELTMAAFDGTNIWVTSPCGVTKLQAVDGANLGTFKAEIGIKYEARGVAFDGKYIWVASYGDNVVIKFLASDPKQNPQSISVGPYPNGVVFDGKNIWVTHNPPSQPGSVTKIRASDGAIQQTITAGKGPFHPAFDGSNVWVPNYYDGTVTKVKVSDGSIQGTFNVGGHPFQAAFDGTNIWVTNTLGGTLSKLQVSDGLTLLQVYLSGQYGIAFDGDHIWVAHGQNKVAEVRPSDGVLLGDFKTSGGTYGVAFDGANIWVTGTGADDSVSKL